MTREHLGWTVWGLLTLVVLTFELPAVAKIVPWPTLSSTVWGLQQRWPWLTLPLVAALSILTFHISRLRNLAQRTGPTEEDK